MSVYLSVCLSFCLLLVTHSVFGCPVSVRLLVSVFTVFGPTLVRTSDDNMMSIITDMAQQCRIIKSMLSNCEWIFNEESSELQVEFISLSLSPSLSLSLT